MRGPTRDHDEIRQWALAHDAVPAQVGPHFHDSEPTKLQFLFGPAKQGTDELHPISWEQFFALFEMLGLAMVYDNRPSYELLLDEPKPTYPRTSLAD